MMSCSGPSGTFSGALDLRPAAASAAFLRFDDWRLILMAAGSGTGEATARGSKNHAASAGIAVTMTAGALVARSRLRQGMPGVPRTSRSVISSCTITNLQTLLVVQKSPLPSPRVHQGDF